MQNSVDFFKFYTEAYSFLVNNLPKGLTEDSLRKYFRADCLNSQTMSDVYEQFLVCAQDYQQLPNTIKFKEHKNVLKRILCDFDVNAIVTKWDSRDNLFDEFRKKIRFSKPLDDKSKHQNLWWRWCGAAIDSAKFLTQFKSIKDLKSYIEKYDRDTYTRIFLALILKEKITGFGFALACNVIKDLGFVEFSKPDVHIKDVLTGLNFCENNEFSAFECVAQISEECRRFDVSISPYKIDRVIWLICSGRFYLDNIERPSLKKEFIAHYQRFLNRD